MTATNKSNQMLDRIKKSFAKFDCNLLRSLYSTRLIEDAIQMYKFMHEIDKAYRFQVIQTQIRGHSFMYHREISKKQHRYNFFFNRTANL